MYRRLVVSAGVLVAALAGGWLLLAGPASAGTVADRVAQHQAEVRAKIACHRAQMQGKPCQSAQAATAAPAPKATSSPKAPAPKGKTIVISLSEQRLRAYEGGTAVIDTAVSTGAAGSETPTGTYAVQSKETKHWSTQYGVWMPYAMRVVGGIFIHELPVTTDGRRLGASSIGRPVSHGCIRVPVGTAKALFDWASIGTTVIIR